jgi:3'-phosphoadenosine 5'-phosphosulfate sulfotransferase
MNEFEVRVTAILNNIENRLNKLEERISKVPDPFVLYYRPPKNEKHLKVNEALDTVFTRIEILEDRIYDSWSK